MGWFDNEQGTDKQKPSPQPNKEPLPRPSPSKPPPSPTSSPAAKNQDEGGGSTLGPEIHIDGTIVCGEDLTILGKVEGTIRAKGTLTIAREADVRAAIDGQRVLVQGKVEGNVEGAERVVLGPSARLDGDIQAPALEISEGAYFKGKVDMQPASAARAGRDTKSSEGGTKSPSATSAAKPDDGKQEEKKEDKNQGSDKQETKGAGDEGGKSGDGGDGDSSGPKPATAGKTKGAETPASH